MHAASGATIRPRRSRRRRHRSQPFPPGGRRRSAATASVPNVQPGARLCTADSAARPQQDRRSQRADPAQPCGRNAGTTATVNTVVIKGAQPVPTLITTRRRIAAGERRLDAGDDTGAEQLPLHAADGARRARHDVAARHFVKPEMAIAMTFADDATPGPALRPFHRIGVCDAAEGVVHGVQTAPLALRQRAPRQPPQRFTAFPRACI